LPINKLRREKQRMPVYHVSSGRKYYVQQLGQDESIRIQTMWNKRRMAAYHVSAGRKYYVQQLGQDEGVRYIRDMEFIEQQQIHLVYQRMRHDFHRIGRQLCIPATRFRVTMPSNQGHLSAWPTRIALTCAGQCTILLFARTGPSQRERIRKRSFGECPPPSQTERIRRRSGNNISCS
jgi:hypothetical protein